MNEVILCGRLAREPELRRSATGKAFAFIQIATQRTKDTADFPEVTCLGSTAEFVCKYFEKGSNISLRGHIETGSYEKDGKKLYTQKIVADYIEFAGYKKTGSSLKSDFLPGNESADAIPEWMKP